MKHYGNQLAALLSNWETYEKMLGDYQNSSGSAAAEAQKTADSLTGRLNKLSNTWNKTVATVVDSDILKVLVSIGTGAIDTVDKMNLLQTAMVGLTGLGTIKGGQALISWFKNATTSALMFGNAVKTVQASEFVATTENLTSALTGLNSKQMISVLSTESLQSSLKGLSREQLVSTLYAAGLSKVEAETTAATLVMSTAQTTATGTTWSLSSAFSGLGAVIAANPIGAAITAITAIVSIGSFAMNSYKQSQEEMLENAKETVSSYKESSTAISDYTKSIVDLRTKLDSGNLSTEETTSIKSQLLDIQKQLIESYGSEADGIDLVSGKLQDQLGVLKNVTKEKSSQLLTENQKAFETATSKMESKKRYVLTPLIDNTNDIASSVKSVASEFEKQGIKIEENGGPANFLISFNGDASKAESVIDSFSDKLRDLKSKYGEDNIDLNNILGITSESYNKAKKILDEYGESYKQSIIAKTYDNDNTSDAFYNYTNSISQYNNSLASGKGLDEAKKQYEDAKLSVQGLATQYPYLSKAITIADEQLLASGNASVETATKVESSANVIKSTFDALKSSDSSGSEKNYLDDFQSSISNIQQALESLDTGDLTQSDVLDLMQQFGINANQVDLASKSFTGLKEALQGVASTSLNEILTILDKLHSGGQITDSDYTSLTNVLKQIASSVTPVSDLNSALDAYTKKVDEIPAKLKDLESIQSNMKEKKFSYGYEEIQELLTKYPELQNAIYRTADGWRIEQSAITDVKNVMFDLSNEYTAVQTALTNSLSAEAKTRLEAMGYELETIKTTADAYAQISQKHQGDTSAHPVSDDENDMATYAKTVEDANKKLELNQKKLADLKSGKTSGNSGSSSKSSSGSGTKDKTKTTTTATEYDFIETKLNRLSNALSKFKQKIQDAFSLKGIKNNTANALDEVNKSITANKAGYSYYMKKANSVGLSSSMEKKIRDGAIDIDTFKDEKLKAKIDNYQKWYEKAKNAKETIVELRKEESELLKLQATETDSLYDSKAEKIQKEIDKTNALQSIKEAQGKSLSEDDYKESIRQQQELKDNRIAEIEALRIQQYNLNQESKTYQEDWDFINNIIADAEIEVLNNEKAIVDLGNTLQESVVERLQTMLGLANAYNATTKTAIDLKRQRGQTITKSDYDAQFENNDSMKSILESQKSLAQENMNKYAMGSADWNKYATEFHNLDEQIIQLEIDNESLKESMREDIKFSPFNKAIKEIDAAMDKFKALNDLYDDSMFFDYDGKMTEYGNAYLSNTIELYKRSNDKAKESQDAYFKAVNSSSAFYNNDGSFNKEAYDDTVKAKYDEYMANVKESSSFRKEIVSMEMQLRQKEIEQIQKLAKAHIDALNKQKSYYDYSKQIKAQTKDVEKLTMQYNALSGVQGKEAEAKRKRLQEELASANETLADTKSEHEFSLITDGLNDFTDDMQTNLDKWESMMNTSIQAQVELVENLKTIFGSYGSRVETSAANTSAVSGADGSMATTMASNKEEVAKLQAQYDILKASYTKMGYEYNDFLKTANMSNRGDAGYNSVLTSNMTSTKGQMDALEARIKGLKGFKYGGIAKVIQSKGEDGLALVQNDEGFVMPEHVQDIRSLLDFTPVMTRLISGIENVKFDSKSTSPIVVNIDNMLKVGHLDKPLLDETKKLVREITNEVTNNLASQCVKAGLKLK